MKIALVHVGSTLTAIGFRFVAAAVRRHFDALELFFVVPESGRSITHILRDVVPECLDKTHCRAIANELVGFDVIGFSCMTENADDIKAIIRQMRLMQSGAMIVWGGIHAILHPEEAIQYADAVCTGEGELAFVDLLRRLSAGVEYHDTANFWFRGQDGGVIQSPARSLPESNDLDQLPPPLYSYAQEKIYRKSLGAFTPALLNDFIHSEALAYNMLWTRGCPFSCNYCCNSTLNQLNGSSRIRFCSVDHMIEEVQQARAIFPHISAVRFLDDAFISLPMPVLEEFAVKWKTQVNLPFWVVGANPVHIKEDKIALLIGAGMNSLRVGLQSGSDRILKFYRRPNRPRLLQEITTTIARYSRYMMPPLYDIILDNPIENVEDVKASLQLVNGLPRPVVVNLFSLRFIPNTDLGIELERLGVEIPSIGQQRYLTVYPTWPNVLIVLSSIIRVPDALFDRMLAWTLKRRDVRPHLRFVLLFLKLVSYVQRVWHQFRHFDFSILFGKTGYVLWKLGVVQFMWKRSMLKRSQIGQTVFSR